MQRNALENHIIDAAEVFSQIKPENPDLPVLSTDPSEITTQHRDETMTRSYVFGKRHSWRSDLRASRCMSIVWCEY